MWSQALFRTLGLMLPLALAAPEPAPAADPAETEPAEAAVPPEPLEAPVSPDPAAEAPPAEIAPTAAPAKKTPNKPVTPAKPPSKATPNLSAKRLSDPEAGQVLYERSCVQCHGPRGRGDGQVAADLVGGVPDLDGKIVQGKFEDPIRLIQDGKGRMPAFAETIDRHDTRRILVYLTEVMSGRTEPGKAGPKKAPVEVEEDEGN